MKYADINKKFTEILTNILGSGYTVATQTMSGHQGEIAKVILEKDGSYLALFMETFHEREDDWTRVRDGIRIVTGFNPNYGSAEAKNGHTFWLDKVTVLDEWKFYEIGRNSRFYGTKEEADAALDLSFKRRRTRYVSREAREFVFPLDVNNKDIRRKVVGLVRRLSRESGARWMTFKSLVAAELLNDGSHYGLCVREFRTGEGDVFHKIRLQKNFNRGHNV